MAAAEAIEQTQGAGKFDPRSRRESSESTDLPSDGSGVDAPSPREGQESASAATAALTEFVDDDELAEMKLRDIKVATIGNVDSGKSTLVGVLTKGGLDDGRGLARSKVFNFSHEQANGRTSSIAQELMGFQTDGDQVLVEREGCKTVASRNAAWQQIVQRSEKLVTFVDLCGHEKYLKTTILGLTSLCPDYAMIVVNANAGFQKMSREHLGIALALKIPFVIVVTKTDVAPKNVLEENLQFLQKMMKSKAIGKQAVMVQDDKSFKEACDGHRAGGFVPIFQVSNVTGEGLDFLRNFIKWLPSRWLESGLFRPSDAPVEFHIDGKFNVNGVGVVASGLMRGGTVLPNQQLLMGPDKTNQFRPVQVKAIHYKRCPVESVVSGQHCSFALKSLVKKEQLKKSHFRKGMVLVDASSNPKATLEFKAEVVILHHATTIREGYQAIIHCGVIRQAATVKVMTADLLRTGDKAIVTFRFMFQGEFLRNGETILFREGRTKGLGKIVELVEEKPDA
jgi:GTPase